MQSDLIVARTLSLLVISSLNLIPFIISITGPDFFKRNFTLVKDGFFTEDDDPNIPSAFSLRYSSPNSYPEDVVYSVLYKFSIPGKNWINEPIRFNFDSANEYKNLFMAFQRVSPNIYIIPIVAYLT